MAIKKIKEKIFNTDFFFSYPLRSAKVVNLLCRVLFFFFYCSDASFPHKSICVRSTSFIYLLYIIFIIIAAAASVCCTRRRYFKRCIG